MNVTNVKIYDLEESIKASKYPMSVDIDICDSNITKTVVNLGSSEKGEGHDNYLNGIRVAFDLTFSNKAWVEMERYHFIDFVSSQSTMHRITSFELKEQCNGYVDDKIIEVIQEKIDLYTSLKDKTTDYAKELYLEILYNIPSGFELTARLTTNYRQLKTILSQRSQHRLPEWREFCDWIITLPKFKELCLRGE